LKKGGEEASLQTREVVRRDDEVRKKYHHKRRDKKRTAGKKKSYLKEDIAAGTGQLYRNIIKQASPLPEKKKPPASGGERQPQKT